MALSGQLGKTIQRLRKAYNLSLSELAEQSVVNRDVAPNIQGALMRFSENTLKFREDAEIQSQRVAVCARMGATAPVAWHVDSAVSTRATA